MTIEEHNNLKVYTAIRVLKILDNIGTEFLNQKEPLIFMAESDEEAEENKVAAMERIKELEFFYQETERASQLVKNNLFELVD